MDPIIGSGIVFGILWIIAALTGREKPVRRHELPPVPLLPPEPPAMPPEPPVAPPEPLRPEPARFAGRLFGSGDLRAYLREAYSSIVQSLATEPPPPPPGEFQAATMVLPDPSRPELPRLIGAKLAQDGETSRNLAAAIQSAFPEGRRDDTIKILLQVAAQMALGRIV